MQTEVQTGQRPRVRSRVFYGWYIVAAGMGIHLWVSIVWVYGMQVFFTPIVETFGWSRALVSGAFGLQRLEGSVLAPVEGFLVDRIGPRKMILAGAFITGLGLISLSFLSSIWMFYLSVLLVSLGTSLAGTPRNWAIVQWFRRQRGRALGIGASGAVISGPLLFMVVWLVETVGWRSSFLVTGVATWFVCIPLALVFRSKPQQYGQLPDGDLPGDALAETAAVGSSRTRPQMVEDSESLSVMQALRTRTFWVLSLVFGAQTMGVSGLMVHLIPYLQTIDFSTSEAASVLAFFTVLSVFGRLGGGWIMDYIDPRYVLAGLLGCLAASFILLANITAYWQVVPFALLYGTAFGGMMPARSLLVSNYFGTQNFGALQGLTRSVTVVAGVISPVLLGLVFDITQSYVLAFYILVVVALAAVPLALMARPPKPAGLVQVSTAE